MLHSPPLVPPILGGNRNSKSPKFGGFRGLDRWPVITVNLCILSSPSLEEGLSIGIEASVAEYSPDTNRPPRVRPLLPSNSLIWNHLRQGRMTSKQRILSTIYSFGKCDLDHLLIVHKAALWFWIFCSHEFQKDRDHQCGFCKERGSHVFISHAAIANPA